MAVIPAVFNLSAFPLKRRWERGCTGLGEQRGKARPGKGVPAPARPSYAASEQPG